MSRNIVLAVAALAIALLLSVAFFGHRPNISTEQLKAKCQANDVRITNMARARACRALRARENPKKRPTQQ